MNEKEILLKLGFKSKAGLRAYLKKLTDFYLTLNKNEKSVFLKSMASIDDALELFDDKKIDAKQLEDFIRANEPPGAPIFIIQGIGTRGD